jgi:uncharacterized protein YjcR
MPRARSEARDMAEKLWLESGGKLKLTELAKKFGVKDSKVRKWKAVDKWDSKLSGALQKTNGSAPIRIKGNNPSKKGAPKGNKNALGHGAPKGNTNALGNRGGNGGPPRNKKGLKTGEYESIWMDALTPEQANVLERIDTDPIKQIDDEIKLLAWREREMMMRIRRLTDGLTEKQRQVLQERKEQKEPIKIYDDSTGQEKVVIRTTQDLVVTKIEETEYRAIDDILRIEDALTRVQDKKVKAVKTKYELMGENERRLRIEKMKQDMDIAKERHDLEKIKVLGDPDDTADDGFIDALHNKAGEAWDGFTEED